MRIRVVNYGSPSYGINGMSQMMDVPLNKGDIIVLEADDLNPEIPDIKILDDLGENRISDSWMIEDPRHMNHRLGELCADEICRALLPVLSKDAGEPGEEIFQPDFVKERYIDRYFRDFDAFSYEKIGSIVMNCNPFTYGHRYLIEQALKRVDFLIIFVVEENESVFSFNERFAMVCEGVADMENVKAVPSGPFILSKLSFPEYFIKVADEDIQENTENDILFFAERIAPYLNIRFRFVGEEPDDAVTNKYNDAMKKILPPRGIELVEIPRKRAGESRISASMVRKYLEKNDEDSLEALLPESTKRFLKKSVSGDIN